MPPRGVAVGVLSPFFVFLYTTISVIRSYELLRSTLSPLPQWIRHSKQNCRKQSSRALRPLEQTMHDLLSIRLSSKCINNICRFVVDKWEDCKRLAQKTNARCSSQVNVDLHTKYRRRLKWLTYRCHVANRHIYMLEFPSKCTVIL